MSLPLTPHILAAAYEYLRTTQPFSAWHLPPAEEVELGITRHRDREADHSVYTRTHEHCIRVSSTKVKTSDALIQAIAHEMIHAYQDGIKRTGSRRVDHNKEFTRLAKRVCSVHGWEVEKFL